MKCPLSGKPCLHPKEVFVKEIMGEETNHLFLCKMCSENYVEQLPDSNTVTKSLELVSSINGIRHSEHIVSEEEVDKKHLKSTPSKKPRKDDLSSQIEKIEVKIKEAIDREDYESAAQLKAILGDLKNQSNDKNNDSDSDSDSKQNDQ